MFVLPCEGISIGRDTGKMLVDSFLLRRLGFSPMLEHVGFVVSKVTILSEEETEYLIHKD